MIQQHSISTAHPADDGIISYVFDITSYPMFKRFPFFTSPNKRNPFSISFPQTISILSLSLNISSSSIEHDNKPRGKNKTCGFEGMNRKLANLIKPLMSCEQFTSFCFQIKLICLQRKGKQLSRKRVFENWMT